jgi:hypothetical protein
MLKALQSSFLFPLELVHCFRGCIALRALRIYTLVRVVKLQEAMVDWKLLQVLDAVLRVVETPPGVALSSHYREKWLGEA